MRTGVLLGAWFLLGATPIAAAPIVSSVQIPTAPAAAAPARTPAVAPAAAPRRAVVVTAAPSSVRPGDDSHVVQRGESLWTIASALLGNDASTARVAREVERLWALNQDRIGTGDRNLLIAGTKLEL